MRYAVLAISGVAVLLAILFVAWRSEMILNIDVLWLTAAGLALSLWNYQVRENVRGATAFLDGLKGVSGTIDPEKARRALEQRREEGIVEGLIIAGVGSLLGAAGQIFLLIVAPG